jgi:transcriptional regulator with XRE-family HTH domain
MAARNTEIGCHIGLNLRRARKAAGLSQEDVGFRAGLHRTAVSQLERGERVPRADSVIRLAGVLGIPPGDLLAGVVWEPIAYTAGGYGIARCAEAETGGTNGGEADA